MANNICHVEISSRDAKKASEFYNALFGWEMNLSMGEEYILFNPGTEPGGGISKVEDFSAGTNIVFYVQVDDIEASLKKAEGLGASTKQSKSEIPGHGWFALFNDPDGNVIGLFTAI